MLLRFKKCLLAVLTLALAAGGAAADKGYLRTPDIHGDTIVFCAEGDLWLCSDEGGEARRLSTHEGREYYPRFSPDGKWIAFSGQYNGNRDVFLISTVGGGPRRMTWHPATDEVVGWTPDGKYIIFRSWREHPMFSRELYKLPVSGGDAEKLPLGWAARIDIDPDSKRWAFCRTSRENATWKRYRGGTHETIWVGDPAKEDYVQITDFDGTNAFPMWHEGMIYYLCDRGGTYNIWSMDPDGSQQQRLTNEGKWDARWPAMGEDGRIVYMLAGGLKIFDPSTRRSREVDIELSSERLQTRERFTEPGRWLTDFALSPDGERVALITRGEVFSVPVEAGVTLPISKGSDARERFVSFDKDGKRVLYLSDHSGEEGYYSADAWGRGDVKTELEPQSKGYLFYPAWSPDGKWIAYANSDQELCIVDEDGKAEVIDRSDQTYIRDFEWSPDSRWLAYSKSMPNSFSSIFIYDTRERMKHQVTSDYTDDNSPAWDPDGEQLYFASNRFMNPRFGNRDYNLIENDNSQLYLILLQADGENPFAETAGLPPGDDDEEDADDDAEDEDSADSDADDEDEDEDDGDDAKDEEAAPIEIDFEGIEDRVVQLPGENGNYFALAAISGKLFYFSVESRGQSEERQAPTLMSYDIEEKEADVFASEIRGFDLQPAADKIALLSNGSIFVVGSAAPPGADLMESKVSLDGIVLEIDPSEEWAQIYDWVWRRCRDRFWDADMCGLDWKALRKQYAELLPLISDREELSDLLGELIGELSMGHTYVMGAGDSNFHRQRVGTGLLGADFLREGDAYRVERILRGAAADNIDSPLLAPGVGVKEGDYILAVNGMPLYEDRPFCANFENQAQQDIMITVAADAAGENDRRDVMVHSMGIDNPLRYHDWVRDRREYVLEKTDGKMGYIHIPDMGYAGMIAFNTWFYPQLDKEGMVVDVRWNGGGSTSQLFLERLRRPLTAWDITRNGNLSTYPYAKLNGPFVVLANEFAGSDGDIFPRAVQLEKLAPVIGMRTWGGVVGIDMANPLIDSGLVTYPHYAWWDSEWGWDLENHGIDPDIEVQNPPQEVAAGIDRQLDRGIEELLELHRQHPPLKPEPQKPSPNTREYFNRIER